VVTLGGSGVTLGGDVPLPRGAEDDRMVVILLF
jgi:hypothetical protein